MTIGRFQKWQAFTFALTALCMITRHICLESYYIVKPEVHDSMGFSTTWLGAFDATYLAFYAFGNFISGTLGDNIPLKYVISGGMILTSFGYAIISILGYGSAKYPWLFLIIFAIVGVTQSAVWPGCVAVMGNWFSKTHRGKIIGTWSSSGFVGDILGAQLGSLLVSQAGFAWESVVISAATILLCSAIFFYLVSKEKPGPEFGDVEKSYQLVETGEELPKEEKSNKKKGISFWKAWMLPGVLVYSLSYACVKMLNYSMIMWLPYFLDKHIDVSKGLIGTMANFYDLGALFGGLGMGWVTDKLGIRAPFVSLMIFLALPTLGIIQLMTPSLWWMFFIINILLGMFIGGADILIAGVISTDLGKNEQIKNEEALSTVTGIIDGTGGAGASIGQVIIGILALWSWDLVFGFMFCIGALGLALLVKYSVRDLKYYVQQKKLAAKVATGV